MPLPTGSARQLVLFAVRRAVIGACLYFLRKERPGDWFSIFFLSAKDRRRDWSWKVVIRCIRFYLFLFFMILTILFTLHLSLDEPCVNRCLPFSAPVPYLPSFQSRRGFSIVSTAHRLHRILPTHADALSATVEQSEKHPRVIKYTRVKSRDSNPGATASRRITDYR